MIGHTISHYKILEKLGEGGMGVVYKAQDTKLDRLVALKFLPLHLTENQAEKDRFLQEARSAAALNHPNICTIHAVEESDGEQFIVMEFIDGPSLRKKIDGGSLPPFDAVRIAQKIAEGLGEAHKKGIVHRDLKPENILLTGTGEPKIADFGLALPKHVLQSQGPTRSGTIAYMSPEQVQGSTTDHRADIWSLGVIVYEMIVGRRPFTSEYHQALMYAILNEKHPSAVAAGMAIPDSLEKLIDQCLEKDPSRRLASARDIVDHLRTISKEFRKADGGSVRSIAVLPLEDLSPGKDNKYFSDGLHDEVIANLSKLRNVRVLSRSTMIRFERAEKTTRQIAGELGVQYVLDGSVRKHGSNLRITTQH